MFTVSYVATSVQCAMLKPVLIPIALAGHRSDTLQTGWRGMVLPHREAARERRPKNPRNIAFVPVSRVVGGRYKATIFGLR